MNRNLLFILLIFITQSVWAQLIQTYNFDLNTDKTISVIPEREVSSLAIKSKTGLDGIELYINGKAIEVKQNYHAPNFTSELIFPKESIHEIEIKSRIGRQMTLYSMHIPELKIDLKELKTAQSDSCELPSGIDQSVWRAGLPPPTVGRPSR